MPRGIPNTPEAKAEESQPVAVKAAPAKIKQYSINLSGFASGYPIFETSDNGTRHHV